MGEARPGRVYLVGAGPGDPGLLTVRAAELLRTCDVVVHDYLAEKSLLRLVPPQAERIYVGKTGAHQGAEARQERIHALLVERARQGLRVVRLKGGDPFVFGRGGEEAQELAAAGIGFEVVPGVTSAIAVPAYAGIPVTHREHNTTVAFVTGHEGEGSAPDRTDWGALARIAASGGTVVILMGVKHLAHNLRLLEEAGLAPDTPAAAIQWGTRPEQRVVVGRVGTLAGLAAEAGLRPPAIAVVGSVVRLREAIGWYERRPLAGRRVLVTRAADQAGGMEELLAELGARPVVLPTLEIRPPLDWRPLDDALATMRAYHALLLTSANAVEAVGARLDAAGLDARALAGVEIACVGAGTARALAALGLRADVVPAEHTAEALADALIAAGPVEGRRYLLPLSSQGRPTLARRLREAGAEVEVVIAYRAVPPERPDPDALRLIREGQIDAFTFASPSALRHLAALLGAEELRRAVARNGAAIACIGRVTAEAAEQLGLPVHVVPAVSRVEALVEALVAFFSARDGAAAAPEPG